MAQRELPHIRHIPARFYSRAGRAARPGPGGGGPQRCDRLISTQIHGIAISAHHGNQVPTPITAKTAQTAMRAEVAVAKAPKATAPGGTRAGLAPPGSLGTSDGPARGGIRRSEASGSRYRSMAGRSASSSSISPSVFASSALSIRSWNSSAVSLPAAWCSCSSAVARSRSASDARILGSPGTVHLPTPCYVGGTFAGSVLLVSPPRGGGGTGPPVRGSGGVVPPRESRGGSAGVVPPRESRGGSAGVVPPRESRGGSRGVVPPREYRSKPDLPPSSAVSTQGPSAVIASVCSKCAAQLP